MNAGGFCGEPCDIVSFNFGFSVQDVACMGASIDSDVTFDQFGRATRFKVIYQNGSVEILSVQYNNLGQALSYTIEVLWQTEILRRQVQLEYDQNNQLKNVTCS